MELTLTKDNFDETVQNADKPVLVDFWAEWCSYCRKLDPTLTQLAKKHESDWIIGRVNVDEEKELTDRYEISTIPTLLVFRDGKLINQAVGGATRAQIEEMVSGRK